MKILINITSFHRKAGHHFIIRNITVEEMFFFVEPRTQCCLFLIFSPQQLVLKCDRPERILNSIPCQDNIEIIAVSKQICQNESGP